MKRVAIEVLIEVQRTLSGLRYYIREKDTGDLLQPPADEEIGVGDSFTFGPVLMSFAVNLGPIAAVTSEPPHPLAQNPVCPTHDVQMRSVAEGYECNVCEELKRKR